MKHISATKAFIGIFKYKKHVKLIYREKAALGFQLKDKCYRLEYWRAEASKNTGYRLTIAKSEFGGKYDVIFEGRGMAYALDYVRDLVDVSVL